MRLKLLSLWVWFAAVSIIVGWTFVVAAVRVLTWPFDRRRRLVSRTFHAGARLIAWAHPFWHQRITGTLPPDVNDGYVIICNHESHSDSILISHLPFAAAWLAKEELLRIPFLGWMMRMAGHVSVKRGDRESGRSALDRMADVVKSGGSVFIFPEGTRQTTDELGPFKEGAFRLAIETQRPIVPMVLTGTGNTLPKGGWVLGGEHANARLAVMEPVPAKGLTEADLGALKERVRNAMVEEHRRLKEG